MGGIALEVTYDQFFEYFSKFGRVKEATIMIDKPTNKSRGFGFVTFEDEETINEVLSAEHEIAGRRVEVKRAEPQHNK